MSRSRLVGLYVGVAWAILIMAVPFVVSHVPRILAAVLFDVGCLLAVAGAILLVVEARERRQQRL